MPKHTTVKEVGEAWYDVARTFSHLGASDTEPRAEFAQIVIDLYEDRDPTIPRTARDWQLFTGEGMKGNGLAAAALTRAAKRFVKVANADRRGLVEFAEYHGWA